MQAPGSFKRRWSRAWSDTQWFSWKFDIIPAVLSAGGAVWGAWQIRDATFDMSDALVPALWGLGAVGAWFALSNGVEFIWRFLTAGFKNQIDDMDAVKEAARVAFNLELADRTPLRDGEPSELAIRVLVIGTTKAENCRVRVVKVDGGGYVPRGLDGDIDVPLGWDSPDVATVAAVKSFHGSAVARFCRTVRGFPNFVVIETVGDYTPPNLSTEREYVIHVEVTADNAPRTVAQVKVRAYRFLSYKKKDEDVEVVYPLGNAKWDMEVVSIEPTPDRGDSPNG